MKTRVYALAKCAGKVATALAPRSATGLQNLCNPLSHVPDQAVAIARLASQLSTCRAHRWFYAANRIHDRLTRSLRALRVELERCEEVAARANRSVPETRELLAELRELQDEFGDFALDDQGPTLSVVTEPVELEDTELGRFRICLLLDEFAGRDDRDPIRVIALDPRPAARDGAVTHPHVSGECLCAGDASVALRTALGDGRFCDAFLLIRSVLLNYNAQSAYVALDNWDGRPCGDCGYVMDMDDCCWCEACENEYCEECFGYCHSCDLSRCRSCVTTCEGCHEPACDGCLIPCRTCGELRCVACCEDGICINCQGDEEDNDDNELQTRDDDAANRPNTASNAPHAASAPNEATAPTI